MRTRSTTKMPRVHLITGGGGFPGFSLGKKLVEEGHRVRLFDIREPVWELVDGMEFVKGDITDMTAVNEALEGVDIVYHMASYGMSGREQLNRKLIEKVNITGTENVLKACHNRDITRLVYTSTYNVVFGGEEIRDGDESLPYLAEDRFTDYYSYTKMLSEKKVLGANGSKTANQKTLNTCALRLAGVYGPGEQRHIPRIVSYLEQGLVVVTYGSKESLVDFLHVDNLVQAHSLAGQALCLDRGYIAAGQAYFISDGKPINNFEFFRPLFEGLGYSFPKVNLPLSLVFYMAFLTEIFHSIVGRIYNFQPLLTRTEVYKTGVTHTFSISKAHSELGYTPTVQNNLSEVLKYYQRTGHVRHKHQRSALRYWVENIIIGLIFFSILMSFLPGVVGSW